MLDQHYESDGCVLMWHSGKVNNATFGLNIMHLKYSNSIPVQNLLGVVGWCDGAG